jgi:hypothetical protein
MAADSARRAAAASKRGVFGTASSSRQHSVIDECLGFSSSGSSSRPGPGCYDSKAGLAENVAAAATRPSPVRWLFAKVAVPLHDAMQDNVQSLPVSSLNTS